MGLSPEDERIKELETCLEQWRAVAEMLTAEIADLKEAKKESIQYMDLIGELEFRYMDPPSPKRPMAPMLQRLPPKVKQEKGDNRQDVLNARTVASSSSRVTSNRQQRPPSLGAIRSPSQGMKPDPMEPASPQNPSTPTSVCAANKAPGLKLQRSAAGGVNLKPNPVGIPRPASALGPDAEGASPPPKKQKLPPGQMPHPGLKPGMQGSAPSGFNPAGGLVPQRTQPLPNKGQPPNMSKGLPPKGAAQPLGQGIPQRSPSGQPLQRAPSGSAPVPRAGPPPQGMGANGKPTPTPAGARGLMVQRPPGQGGPTVGPGNASKPGPGAAMQKPAVPGAAPGAPGPGPRPGGVPGAPGQGRPPPQQQHRMGQQFPQRSPSVQGQGPGGGGAAGMPRPSPVAGAGQPRPQVQGSGAGGAGPGASGGQGAQRPMSQGMVPQRQPMPGSQGQHLRPSAPGGVGGAQGVPGQAPKGAQAQPPSNASGSYAVAQSRTTAANKEGRPFQQVPQMHRVADERQTKALLQRLLNSLRKEDKNGWFAKPVTETEAPGYANVIRRPMSFETLQKKIENGEVRNFIQFRRDVDLMLLNAQLFNPPYHDAWKDAHNLRQIARRFYDQYIDKEPVHDLQPGSTSSMAVPGAAGAGGQAMLAGNPRALRPRK